MGGKEEKVDGVYLYKYIKRRAKTRNCATWRSP